MKGSGTQDLIQGLLAGNRRALARAITLIENRDPAARDILRHIYPLAADPAIIGVTGAPGVGKSTLVAALTRAYRARGRRVGVLAVDPSSPFTGGALLGDRVRLMTAERDDDVYFRSVATRGRVGGLSRATASVLQVMAAASFDPILLETVGAGQSEVEVMGLAETVLVVLAPGLGDEIQAFKAGILEIGDIFVVNKADREGADRTVTELKAMLALGPGHPGEDDGHWRPPVIKTVARDGEGIEELIEAIVEHRRFVRASGRTAARRRRLAEQQLWESAAERLVADLQQAAQARSLWSEAVAAIAEGRRDPDSVVEDLLAAVDGRKEASEPQEKGGVGA
ncbi:MAG TPA: methylmalonyl Co-A mutase-associated GTPase MeaB [Sphingobacteriaceae bacterium]|nr:methylmalonyl Co-A mutase-associated GTPase MeaB [Sphingobacteriaceae bacterium]